MEPTPKETIIPLQEEPILQGAQATTTPTAMVPITTQMTMDQPTTTLVAVEQEA
jgi:hypothetical protein